MAHELDNLIRQKTGFQSFEDLVSARGNYVPTIRIDADPEMRPIAEAYDAHMAATGDLRRAFVSYPKKEQERKDKIAIAMFRAQRAIERSRRIAAAELKTLENAHAAAISENRARDLQARIDTYGHDYDVNDSITVWSNQAEREGTVLALIGNEIIVEYEMPGTTSKWAGHPAAPTSALRIMRFENGKEVGAYKSVSYRNVPKKWLTAIKDAGMTDWIGMSQASTTRIPFPA